MSSSEPEDRLGRLGIKSFLQQQRTVPPLHLGPRHLMCAAVCVGQET